MKDKSEAIPWKVEFDGVLSPPVRASLLEELFKFIIFERRQIPTAFDILKRSENGENQDPAKSKLHDRKMEVCIEGIDKILRCIREVFQQTDRVHEVVVILGPTVVSPKEIYTLKLPEGDFDGEPLPRRKCVQTMIRKLITKDIFKSCKELNTTNIHVLLHCPSDVKVENLQPKLNFEVPKRGQKFELEIACTCEKVSEVSGSTNLEHSFDEAHPLMRMLAECDISGVGLLDATTDEPEVTYRAASGQENDDVTSGQQSAEASMVWFKVNANVKGCKGRASDCAGMGWC